MLESSRRLVSSCAACIAVRAHPKAATTEYFQSKNPSITKIEVTGEHLEGICDALAAAETADPSNEDHWASKCYFSINYNNLTFDQ